MGKPFWFNAILQWKETGKGEYGITFPFLIGAIATLKNEVVTENFITDVFDEILNNPVSGYYCEVRQCGNIDEPVASIKPLSDLEKVSIRDSFEAQGQVSYGFTTDLMSMFALNCKDASECRVELIKKTLEITVNGNYSKNGGKFTPFSDSDKKFIEHVSALDCT
ncbi:MAG: hypothetical protein HRT53_20935 [Colwellia sp.]|nr:hypothetical protein [Colwellia sp.]